MRIPNLKVVLFWWTLYGVSLLITDAARNVPTALWMVTRTRHAVSLLVYPLRTTCSSPLQRDS